MKAQIFLSWSKPTSERVAYLLRKWLPEVIQQVEPWVSSEDIPKGQRWSTQIANRLEETRQGLICVTRENQAEPWLNFEAGALAKSQDGQSRVRPVLLDLAAHELMGPLSDFQATVLTDQADVMKLVKSINEICPDPLDQGRLEGAFERRWSDFDKQLSEIIHSSGESANDVSPRSQEDMVREILQRVRIIEGQVSASFSAHGLIDLSNDSSHAHSIQLETLERRIRERTEDFLGKMAPSNIIVDFDTESITIYLTGTVGRTSLSSSLEQLAKSLGGSPIRFIVAHWKNAKGKEEKSAYAV
ncbi:MAG: toll/interleukin-1 receptor domain-containing protein [Candidatus Binatia bacterium]